MISASSLKNLEETYYSELAQFKARCLLLIEKGLPYQVVVLNHELFRYLYPNEPYLRFTHSEPVAFAVEHLSKLNKLASSILQTVHGYSQTFSVPFDADTVEVQTADLYSDLWERLDRDALLEEARLLLARRLTEEIITDHIEGRRVLDMGCGSGRYSLALAALGATEVVAVDYRARAFKRCEAHAQKHSLPVTFLEADILALPFADHSFDFVFSNGVLHHTRNWKLALCEYGRIVRRSGYLYLYGCGGFFWSTRAVMREIFSHIPRAYTQTILNVMRMPSNRFIFMDVWYVPIENYITRIELEDTLQQLDLNFSALRSHVPSDLNSPIACTMPGAEVMWGEGEHRYLVTRN
jgi:ubiquinone/menaquinone biosynthesis C-methylase UbiE